MDERSQLSRNAEIVLQMMHIMYCADGFIDSGAVDRRAELWSAAGMDPSDRETTITELKDAGYLEEVGDDLRRVRLTADDRRWVMANEPDLLRQWKRRAPMMFSEDETCEEMRILGVKE